jgi:hypothetical protein
VSTDTIRSGEVTLRMSADFAAIMERIEGGAQAATVQQTYALVSSVAADAESAWYRQVDRETGKSGNISADWTERGALLSFRIGNSDQRRDKRSGKPILFFIHRPGPFSTKERATTETERQRMREAGQPVLGKRKYPNPKASDGRNLLAELITKPANAMKRNLMQRLGNDIVRAIERKDRRKHGGA